VRKREAKRDHKGETWGETCVTSYKRQWRNEGRISWGRNKHMDPSLRDVFCVKGNEHVANHY
jgi:hypothetical protein